MANKPSLRINAGDEHTIEIVGPAAGKEFTKDTEWGEKTKYIYDIKAHGREQTLWATQGLQNEIERSIGGARVGDTLVVSRRGKGLDTRWDVAYARDDAAPHRSSGGAVAAVRSGSTTPAESLSDLDAALQVVDEYVTEKYSGESVEAQQRRATALFLGSILRGSLPSAPSDDSSDVGGGDEPEAASGGKTSPHVWIAQTMHKAGVHPTRQVDVLNVMLSEDMRVSNMNEADERHAKVVYVTTKGGADLGPIEGAADTLEDFPPDEDMPF